MLKAYKEMKLRGPALEMIERANQLIAEYQADGLVLNLRQMHYQFVSRNWYLNTDANYDLLGRTLTNGRMCGLVSWHALEDQERNLERRAQWRDAKRFMEIVVPQFHIDLWDNQPRRVEVWVEKKAVLNAVSRVCRPLDVPYIACKGYMSATEEWDAGQRIKANWRNQRQETTIIYLGDHDPSGLHMTEDHVKRLSMFAERDVDVRRVALNYDQVLRYQPPNNPTKDKDSRSPAYKDLYGESCWELDALSPRLISFLVKRAVLDVRDEDAWNERVQFFRDERQKLADTTSMDVSLLVNDDEPQLTYEEEALDDGHEEVDDEDEEDRARREYNEDDGHSDPFDNK